MGHFGAQVTGRFQSGPIDDPEIPGLHWEIDCVATHYDVDLWNLAVQVTPLHDSLDLADWGAFSGERRENHQATLGNEDVLPTLPQEQVDHAVGRQVAARKLPALRGPMRSFIASKERQRSSAPTGQPQHATQHAEDHQGDETT